MSYLLFLREAIMLGTNDAKDAGSGGPPNWEHECGGANNTSLEGCTFAAGSSELVHKLVTNTCHLISSK